MVIDINGNLVEFEDFTILDSLKIRMTSEFLTTKGYLSNDTIDVGYISFDDKGEISIFEYNQPKMKNLDLSGDVEIVGGVILNERKSGTIDLNNPEDIKKK